MHEISDKFRAALTQSRTIVSKGNLYRRDELLYEDIPITGGSIVDDGAALVRRRVDLQLPGTSEILALLPANSPELGGLWPVGNELHLFTGIDYEDGTDPEYINAGVYRVSRPRVTDTGDDITMSISGYDRSRTVQRAKFTRPYNIRAGVNYATAIRDLLFSRLAWLTEDHIKFMETEYTTPVLTFTHDDDPWEMAVKMAASFGAYLYWDHAGNAMLRPEPDPSVNPPVFNYHEGEDAVITNITRDLDEEDSYNGVIMTAENTSNATPIRAEVWDTDPTSATYYDPKHPAQSLYGPNPKFVSSEFITNTTQAITAVRAELIRELGIVESIDFGSLVNPAHESNDIISLRRARMHIDNVYILESFKADLGSSGTMTGTTRKRRIAS